MPKISIIIATKNAKSLLEETLQNLQAQDYPHLEVIVIDGASHDGTRDLLAKSPYSVVSKWISEPDQGIADAFNKGITLSTGEYINFQGAGDVLCEPKTLSNLFHQIKQEPDLVCARVLRVKEDGVTPIWTSPRHPHIFHVRSLLFKMVLPHQALFTHRRFFEKFGLFDPSIRFAMDYEILLRAYHHFPSVYLSNQVVSRWRAGGIGTNRIEQIFDEYDAIKRKHRVAPDWVLTLIDWFTRAKYRLKSYLKRAYTRTTLILGKAPSERSPRNAHLVHDWGEKTQATQHKIQSGKSMVVFQIMKYIINNNVIGMIPIRMCQAFFYQIYKRLFSSVLIKKLFNGTKLYLFPQSPIASAFVYTAIPDRSEIEALRLSADQNTIFLDVGANIGAYCLLLKDKVKEVYAFEAHPETAKLCKKNFELNHIDQKYVKNVAVSSNCEPLYITNFAAGDPTNHLEKNQENGIKISATTLDLFSIHYVNLRCFLTTE